MLNVEMSGSSEEGIAIADNVFEVRLKGLLKI